MVTEESGNWSGSGNCQPMMLVSFPYFIMVGIPGVFNTKTLISKNQELDVGVGAGAGIYPLKIWTKTTQYLQRYWILNFSNQIPVFYI